ncbi:iron-containing alcohol dehydrogenase [Trichococcus ilyis]|jgi:alcohol dehydrogenase class IV|uniref:Alcohol dehydrogenase iron-type n=1 Tax=Trichococcus ilyis TaxID=640938 RepID=A0A143Z1K6_9LACT|nr:iron-containing alcohol dehydrogenase [Trichococcus ilyis]CZR04294.1 alcohol dehydrogenase iron-type [Trichococcus ilyis]SEJ55179.1 Alcohol dehydrogenase, class IV [Trichococcus ilyis]
MAINQLKVPGKVFSGNDSYLKLNDIIAAEAVKAVILITDKGIEGAGITAPVLELLDAAGVNTQIFYHVQAEPTYNDVTQLVNEIGDAAADYIVAVGGGSVLDVAKLVSVLKGASYSIENLLETPGIAKKQVKAVLIPTTCGTGSEATCNAIVGVPEKGIKIGIVNDELIPDVAILDAGFVKKLPQKHLAAAAVDALCHCVECYTSNKANAFSDLFAAEGAKLIFHNIREAYADAANLDARAQLLIGSFYGGVAITSSGTTAVHALSYPLGGEFHIPHGVANAILFEKVMRVNKPDITNELAALCDAAYPQQAALSAEEKAEFIIEEIADIVKKLEIPADLSGFGVQLKDLDFLVEAGSGVRRLLDNNKRALTKEEITDIYLSVLNEQTGGEENE